MTLVDATVFLLEKRPLEVDGDTWVAQETRWGHRRDGPLEIRFVTDRIVMEEFQAYPGVFYRKTVGRNYYRTVLVEPMETDTTEPKVDTNELTRLIRGAKETTQ